MKQTILLFLLSLSLFAQQKNVEYVNEMSIMIGDSENGFSQNVGRSLAYELQFQYNGLDFPIKPEIDFIYSQDIPLYTHTQESTTRYSSMMVNGVYEIPYSDLMTPYVKAGVGYTSYANVADSPPSSLYLDTGVGVKLHLTKRLALKFQVLTQFNVDKFDLLATGGISFAFGRKYVAPPPQKVCEPCDEPKVIYITKAPIKVLKPKNIQFKFAKATLTDDSKVALVGFSEELNSDENINKEILIIGNTDSKGTRAFNATLSIKRANAVRSEFIRNDVDPGRISIDGIGEMNPIADNATENGREKNRRVIIILKEAEANSEKSENNTAK